MRAEPRFDCLKISYLETLYNVESFKSSCVLTSIYKIHSFCEFKELYIKLK